MGPVQECIYDPSSLSTLTLKVGASGETVIEAVVSVTECEKGDAQCGSRWSARNRGKESEKREARSVGPRGSVDNNNTLLCSNSAQIT